MQQIYDAIRIDSINYPFTLLENEETGTIHVFATKEELVEYLTVQFGGNAVGKLMTQTQIDLLLKIMQQV